MKPVLPALLLTLLAALPAPAADETPGRLFFTPAQRAHLDQLLASPANTSPQRLDGLVSRSDGHQTLFIDGKATAPGPAAQPHGPIGARIVGPDGNLHELRVGERLQDKP